MYRTTEDELVFEDALRDDWARDLEVAEMPLSDRPLRYLGVLLFAIGAAVAGRLIFLSTVRADFYTLRAEHNLDQYAQTPAPRGVITDRFGAPLAESEPVFSAFLDVRTFASRPDLEEPTVEAITRIFNIRAEDVWNLVAQSDFEASTDPLLLTVDISREQIIALRNLQLPTLIVSGNYRRTYVDGPIFSSVIGYTGLVTKNDLMNRPDLTGRSIVGKAGIEAAHEDQLKGQPGIQVTRRDARGAVIDTQTKSEPAIGQALTLTIDADFEREFHDALQNRLTFLGRTAGVGIALDPRNGEVLALVSFPTYDNNLFTVSGQDEEKRAVLSSPGKPLFNRAVSGLYNPGSTIKPLVGIAALAENVIDPKRIIFSPGYLDVPNPYDPENPTRYLDWRYQGDVNLAAAIAQSSNVYFYEVGGGDGDIVGLGISRLREWWQKFMIGAATGIDLPSEAAGLLPSPAWKQQTTGRPWLLGDTYNVSIGQGDLLLTPIQLINYITAIANGGAIYRPHLEKGTPPATLADLTSLAPQIREVQKGMLEAVRAPLGTAHTLSDLPFSVAAKTGSAQVRNNQQENAFFVGYLPAVVSLSGTKAGAPSNVDTGSQLAILILIENSKEGSLNAVPVAKEVLNWYYEHRIANSK